MKTLRYIKPGSGKAYANWMLQDCQETTNALLAQYEAAEGSKKQELYQALWFLNNFNAEQVNKQPCPEMSPDLTARSRVHSNAYNQKYDALNFTLDTQQAEEPSANPEDAIIELITLKRKLEKQSKGNK